jgi:DNA-binding beta-propeller fold protein YncE
VTQDPDAIVIADTDNQRILAWNGVNVSDIEGPGLPAPDGVLSLDMSGDIWWVAYPCQVFARAPDTLVWSSVAGTGYCGDNDRSDWGSPFGTPMLDYAVSIARYSDTEIIVADHDNRRIRRVNMSGNVETIAGSELRVPRISPLNPLQATQIMLNFPSAVARTEYGRLLIADAGSDRIFEVSFEGEISIFAGTDQTDVLSYGDGLPATSGVLSGPSGLVVAPGLGSIFVADAGHDRIRRIDSDEYISTAIGSDIDLPQRRLCSICPVNDVHLNFPTGLAWDDNTFRLYIADMGNDWIRMADFNPSNDDVLVFTMVGHAIFEGWPDNVSAFNSQVRAPSGVAFWGDTLTYTDSNSHCVRQVVNLDDVFQSIVYTIAGVCGESGEGNGQTSDALFNYPTAVSTSDGYNIYVADTGNARVVGI